MTLLTEVTMENADEKVASAMAGFVEAVGAIPKPLQVMAGSPGLFMLQAAVIGYYRNHKNLEPLLLTCTRYLSAKALSYQACIDFNGTMLKKQGMSESELAEMEEDFDKAPLAPKEMALLKFVVAGLNGSKHADEKSISELKELGWGEDDIIDAVNQGFGMLTHGRVVEYFKA